MIACCRERRREVYRSTRGRRSGCQQTGPEGGGPTPTCTRQKWLLSRKLPGPIRQYPPFGFGGPVQNSQRLRPRRVANLQPCQAPLASGLHWGCYRPTSNQHTLDNYPYGHRKHSLRSLVAENDLLRRKLALSVANLGGLAKVPLENWNLCLNPLTMLMLHRLH